MGMRERFELYLNNLANTSENLDDALGKYNEIYDIILSLKQYETKGEDKELIELAAKHYTYMANRMYERMVAMRNRLSS